MNFLMGFLVAVFSVITIAFLAYMVKKHFECQFESEVFDFVSKVKKMETDRKNSCLVMFPETDEQKKFFKKMYAKGVIRENNLSTGGYILSDSYQQVWKDYANTNKGDVVHVRGE